MLRKTLFFIETLSATMRALAVVFTYDALRTLLLGIL